jgi:uncharacterized protein YciI
VRRRGLRISLISSNTRLSCALGSIENDEGGIVGPLFIIDVDNRAAALTLTQHEPFHMAGIFEAVLIRRWRQMQPVLVAGANFISATEANLQLCEEGVHDR